MSDHQTIPDSDMSDRHKNLPPTSKPENITAMSDRVSPTAQQAAVPTENSPSPRHHEHHHHTAQYGGNINPHETTEHVMAVFDRQMMALSEENTPASQIQACEIAEMLLERAELPLAFRVHAHIVLGCGKNGYLHHANEAVRFAEMGQRIYGPGKTAEAQAAVEDLMWQARETLRRAERDMEELKGIKDSVKAGHLKLKSGQKLVYDDHDKAIPKPSTFQPATPSASEISKKSSDKASSAEADAQVISTSDKPGEEIGGEEEEDREPEKERDMESGEGEGEGERDDQFGVQRLPEDLIRTALGGQKSGSGMVNPESTHHATPRRSTRSKDFNKDYFTGKPRKP
ncbi:hypothetical protein JADG_001578 [Aureobasidium aubasidani]|nr:hypothetical protein JADG_001578 [Aureobasidium pullulans]